MCVGPSSPPHSFFGRSVADSPSFQLSLADELMGAIPSPLFLLRDKLAKSFLLGGGRMTTDSGEPKEMDSFLAGCEHRGLFHSAVHPEIQAWSQRVLAISMQKLVDVLVRPPPSPSLLPTRSVALPR